MRFEIDENAMVCKDLSHKEQFVISFFKMTLDCFLT